MKLTILGSGTFMPEIERAGPSYLLEVGNMNFILDFGRGTIDRLLKKKFNLYDVDKIFITHTHIDHLVDLFAYIQFVWDNPEKIKFKNNVIEVYGPKGFKKSMENLFKSIQYDKHVYYKRIKLIDLSNKQLVKIGKINIQAFSVKHSEIRNCLGYRITDGKKIFCYSGDTSKCNALIDLCKNADIALVEADLPKKWKLSHVHMDGNDAGEIANKAKVKKLILTHIADHYLKDVLKDLRKTYKGPAKIARDLMEVKIK
jgi:ribonuclease BN (tRNA processing enzyme)